MYVIITLLILIALAMAFAAIACCKVSGRCSRMEEEIRRYESFDHGDTGINEVN